MSFNFDELAPLLPNKHFEICSKSFFESIPVQKTVSEALKHVFSLFCIMIGRPIMEGYSPPIGEKLIRCLLMQYRYIAQQNLSI